MSLLGYSIWGILRNRRRTFSAVLGVLLAVTFIGGTFIAIDSSARAMLDATLSTLPGDLSYYANPSYTGTPLPPSVTNGSALRNALAGVSGVTDVSVYEYLYSNYGGMDVYDPASAANNSYYFGSLMAIDPAHLPYSMRSGSVAGSLLLPNGTLAIDSQTASYIQAKVGDRVDVVAHSYKMNSTGNYTAQNITVPFTVAAIVTLATSGYYGSPGPYPPVVPGPYPGGSAVAFNARDLPWVTGRLNLSTTATFGTQVQGEIWVDRNRFVNPYDIQATTFQLARLSRQLEQTMALAGYSGTVNDNLSSAVANFNNVLVIQRVVYLLLSSPVILLGLYLGAVGVDLGHAERRRELGVLKTRGASRRQVALLLIAESVLGGVVAAVLGLLFGIGLSRLLVGVVTPYGTSPDYGAFTVTPDTVIAVAILSVLFMLIASYRSARRTASLPIIETLRYYAPGETRLHYSPTLDLVMIGYSVFVYLDYWYVVSTLSSGPASQSNFMITMILVLPLITLPLTPILLIIGSVRLMTRSTGRIYEWTSRVIRPIARNLEYIVSRNLSRNPRRSSNIAIIIALGLAFGIFITAALSSQQAMQEQSIRASVGADLSVTPYSINATAAPGFAANLSAVSGIGRVSEVLGLPATVSPAMPYGSPSVWALDPATYFSVSQPASFFYENPASAQAVQQILATPGLVLITGQFAKDDFLQIGDTLILSVTSYANYTPQTYSVTATVGGIVRFLPGTYNGFLYSSGPAPDAVYGSDATFAKLAQALANSGVGYYGNTRFLASLQPGADWKTVKTNVQALGPADVEVYAEQVALITSNAFFGSFLGFVQMEVAFIVVILTAGLALIIYAASLERTVEFAGITARGSSGWQTAGLLVGEATSIMMIGVVMGFGVGLLTGYLYTSFTAAGITSSEPIIPTLFVFPLDGLLLLVLAPIAMLGTTLLVAWRIARMNVARVLKMRGG